MKTHLTQQKFPAGRRAFRRLICALALSIFFAGPAAAQIILNEGFESAAFPPTGWTRANVAGTSTITWQRLGSSTSSIPNNVPAHNGSFYAWYYCWGATSGNIAELRSPVLNFTSTNQVQVSFWFYRHNYTNVYNDNMDIYVNTSATSTGGTLLGNLHNYYLQSPAVAAPGWYQYTFNVPTSFNGSSNYIIFKANSGFGPDFFLDDVSIFNLAPCTGPPAAGAVTPSGPQTVCPGTSVTLSDVIHSLAANLSTQWIYSTNGGTTWNAIPGATSDFYTTFPITVPTRFRYTIICNNTGDKDSSASVIFNVTGGGAFPRYASLPFVEDFESWSDGCATTDIPSINWTNAPTTGNSSWRRDDQGASASWSTPASGAYTPGFYKTAHSARFHAYYAVGSSAKGSLSTYVDCSAPGNKEVEFYVRTDNGTTPKDSLYLEYSPDAGMTWNLLARYGPGTGTWDYKYGIILPSTSATTVVRWTASQNYGFTGYTDIYLDAVRILPPCGGIPVAGKIDSLQACPGKNFTLSLSGTSAAAGLTYQWQYKVAGSPLGWSNLPGGNVARPSANISVPTFFRAIVICSNALPALSDTSAAFNVGISPFYYCYCTMPTSVTNPSTSFNGIGNVSITTRPANVVLMNNSSGLTYNYIMYSWTVPAALLIMDSTYRFSMTDIAGTNGSLTGAPAAFFLDMNRNGVWDLPQERIMNKTNTTTPQVIFQDFQIPVSAYSGFTGLRAIHGYGIATPVNPCGSFAYNSECEDYLVYIEYPPCNGPVNAGTSFISDSLVCPGYTIDLWNTTYEHQRTGITRTWEVSTNNGASYSAISGSTNVDTLTNVVVTASSFGLRYRLRVICSNTGDTTFSNSLSVANPAPISCYPFASALPPGRYDSSDIGSFVISNFVNPQPMVVSGPHLANPAATRRHTDYTHITPVTLAADSTYRIAIYHIMRSGTHADAVVSVFIDFNQDGMYTAGGPGYPFPDELVYRGTTTASNFYLDSFFTMPANLIAGPTGMRVVLNNDLDVTSATNGNNGAGGFLSGEVEDYVVNLSRVSLGVGSNTFINNLSLFPNPATAKATVVFDAPKAMGHVTLELSTITGQLVMRRSFADAGHHFSTELDLSGKAKGVYFVTIHAGDGQVITRKLVLQ